MPHRKPVRHLEQFLVQRGAVLPLTQVATITSEILVDVSYLRG